MQKIISVGLYMLLGLLLVTSCSKDEDVIPKVDPPVVEPPVGESETLIFTPNESFFAPVGTLSAHLRDKTTGNIYNKYEYYDYISDWKVLTDTISFGIDVKTSGNIIIKPEMGIPTNQNGSKIMILLGNQSKEITLVSTGDPSTYEIQNEVEFENVNSGFHEIKLHLKSLATPGASVGNLNKLHIDAPKNSTNVMRRYRANAVHCKWGIDSNNPIEISVHELTIKSTSQSYYQPIDTPFGYTGSTWDKDTQTFGGYNFSLWSYGANDPVPPFYQESHLIAVGPGLEFGTYGHEGTGVKPRGDHPYIGIDTNVQTIAVRKVPGEKYDTYWSYYLDPVDSHWKLYGCGKTYNETGTLTYLNMAAFVEVPGAASKARSGNRICETQYRGWQLDTSGTWHSINEMKGSSGANNESFRDWKITGNKFSMQMGGWGEPGFENKTLTLSSPDAAPNYLKGTFLDELYKMPATFIDNPPIEVTNRRADLSYKVTDLGTNATAEIFWGTQEGLTKEDKWMDHKGISVNSGVNSIVLDDLTKNTPYFYRIKIKNNEGITWSYETQEFTTGNEAEPAIIPIASFSSSNTTVLTGGAISYTDSSQNYPESWSWTFEGGTPSSSIEQNPSVQYNSIGTYSVSLTVTNTAGESTETKTNYITVSEGGSVTLEAHYNFDGNIDDETSFNRNLSVVGGFTPAYVSDENEVANKAYSAPGETGKYLTNDYKGIGGNSARTVTAWFKTSSEGNRKTIVSWGDNQEGKMFNIMIHDGRVRVEAGSCSLRGTKNDLDNDSWHHVAITYDSADGDKLKDVKIYVDGVLDTNTPDGTDNSYRSEEVVINTDITINNMRIGSTSYSTAYFWRGAIDDVQIYSEALTPSQILALTL